jgi:hypothetical protein
MTHDDAAGLLRLSTLVMRIGVGTSPHESVDTQMLGRGRRAEVSWSTKGGGTRDAGSQRLTLPLNRSWCVDSGKLASDHPLQRLVCRGNEGSASCSSWGDPVLDRPHRHTWR